MPERVISRDQVVNRLRAAGYTFHRQADRVELWRQRGTGQRVAVPRRDFVSEDQTRVILAQAGLTQQQVVEFFNSCARSA